MDSFRRAIALYLEDVRSVRIFRPKPVNEWAKGDDLDPVFTRIRHQVVEQDTPESLALHRLGHAGVVDDNHMRAQHRKRHLGLAAGRV